MKTYPIVWKAGDRGWRWQLGSDDAVSLCGRYEPTVNAAVAALTSHLGEFVVVEDRGLALSAGVWQFVAANLSDAPPTVVPIEDL